MDARERAYEKARIEIAKGCHQDLLCLCTIWEKVQRLRALMGDYWFNALVEEMCLTCTVTPPPPGAPPPPQQPPPPQLPPPETTPRMLNCPIPAQPAGTAQVPVRTVDQSPALALRGGR